MFFEKNNLNNHLKNDDIIYIANLLYYEEYYRIINITKSEGRLRLLEYLSFIEKAGDSIKIRYFKLLDYNLNKKMGCDHSDAATGGKTNSTQGKGVAGKSNQPKTPVLIFTLPGTAKEYLTKCLQSDEGAEGKLNLRFIDIPNQRNIRRYWLKELSNPRDYAVVLYLADLRDHPTLLLTARTLNWFLRNTFKKYDIRILSIISDQSQLDEFKSYLPAQVEMLPLNQNDKATIASVRDLLIQYDEKYQDAKRTRTGTTTTTTHLIMK